jgi:hypothetical protein
MPRATVRNGSPALLPPRLAGFLVMRGLYGGEL